MCIPLWQFFIAVRDFKRSVREVKSNLADIKSILHGSLAMSHELEEVTAEFRNIAEFYSQESKNALRDQLCTTMSAQAHEALYHRDFFKHFKLTFEFEVSKLIEDHDKRTAQLAILDIIQHMKRVVKEWINKFEYDKLKTRLLIELTLYLQESFSQYICDGEDVWPNISKKRRNSNIKTFCEKQNIIQTLEYLLAEHFNTEINDLDCFSNNYTKGHDIIYRQRASRIRRFRNFLTSKIKIKKIGNYYREEISIQVSVDLKRASKETWELEEVLRKRCSELVDGLKALPRNRFVDVLAEENVTNLGHKIAEMTLKSFLPQTMSIYGEKLNSVNSKFKSLLPKQKKSLDKEFEKKEEVSEIISKTPEIYHLTEEVACKTSHESLEVQSERINEQSNQNNCDKVSRHVIEDYETNIKIKVEELLASMLETIPDVLYDNKQNVETNTDEDEGRVPPSLEADSTENDDSRGKTRLLKDNLNEIKDKALKKIKESINDSTSTNKDYEPLEDFKLLLKDELFNSFKKIDLRRLFSKDTFVYAVQRHQQISKLKKADFSLLNTIKDSELVQNTLLTSTFNASKKASERMVIDPQLIYDDLEHVIGNFMKMIGRKSARYTINFIDRSHVMSSKVIDFLGNVHALYQYDLTEDKFCKNIFLNKIIEIIAIDLKEEEVNVLKNIIFAFTNNKENKLAFLKRLEEKLPATLLKKLDSGDKKLIQ